MVAIQVSDSSIHAFVIGEHGDSQCVSFPPHRSMIERHVLNLFQVAWSSATVHGRPLLKALPLTETEREEIATTTRMKADSIIKVKGFTSYGVAAVTARMCEAIIFDHRKILPLSHWQENLGCCLSLPVVLGRKGVLPFPVDLEESELQFLVQSAKALRAVIEENDVNSVGS
jgi:L-lactate dehydrogenase